MAIIFQVPNPTHGHEIIKQTGKLFGQMMVKHGPKGAHIEVTETILPGKYVFTVGDAPNGAVQVDITPGVV